LYKPPETWNPDLKKGVQSDIYSFGIVLHEMFSGYCPWHDKTKEELYALHLVYKRSPPISEELKSQWPRIAQIVESCVRNEPSNRPDALRLLEHLTQVYTSFQQTGSSKRVAPRQHSFIPNQMNQPTPFLIVTPPKHLTAITDSPQTPTRNLNE